MIGILVTRNTRAHPRDTIQILTPVDFVRLRAGELATATAEDSRAHR